MGGVEGGGGEGVVCGWYAKNARGGVGGFLGNCGGFRGAEKQQGSNRGGEHTVELDVLWGRPGLQRRELVLGELHIAALHLHA